MNIINKFRKILFNLGIYVEKVKKNDLKSEEDRYLSLYGKKDIEKRRFYNIGAGGFRHPFWTNIDNPSEYYKSVQGASISIPWDILDGTDLDVEDSCANLVYSSHVIEHVPDNDARRVLKNAFRILKNGGIFRISTIDIDLDYRAFRNNDRSYFDWIDMYSNSIEMERAKLKVPLNKASIQQLFLFHFASSASTLHSDGVTNPIDDYELDSIFKDYSYEDALNRCTERCSIEIQKKYPGNHISWWSSSKLMKFLKEVGFKEVYISGRWQSQSAIFRTPQFFDNTRPYTSLYIEAVK